MDWGEEAAAGGMLRATIGKRAAGTVEELLADDVFIWFSCSDCEAFKKLEAQDKRYSSSAKNN
ncbi:hypothetical protein D3C81_2159660 [compost metagenome]